MPALTYSLIQSISINKRPLRTQIFDSPRSMKTSSNLALASFVSDKESTFLDNETNENGSTKRNVNKGPLAMSIPELSEAIGGKGRALLVWDLYILGVDPQIYFKSIVTDDTEQDYPCIENQNIFPKTYFLDESDWYDIQSIQSLRKSSRKNEKLGKKALMELSKYYPNGIEGMGGIASIADISSSSDGTTKLLIQLQDGLRVETVIIPWFDRKKSTLCVSSQVGCKQGCTFCATGRMGRLRSLTSDEIMAQVFFATKIIRLSQSINVDKSASSSHRCLPSIDNVVFMGMGEPADNYESVNTAIDLLIDRNLFQLSPKKITVSTIAPTPESFKYFQNTNCVLAWSVHAVNDSLRKQLVPTTRYTMNELRDGLIQVLCQRSSSIQDIMLEVVLIRELNDGEIQANELADFSLHIINQIKSKSNRDENLDHLNSENGFKLMINLIPFNDIGHPVYQSPTKESVLKFQSILWKKGLFAHIRTTRGDDESAACGQLATRKLK